MTCLRDHFRRRPFAALVLALFVLTSGCTLWDKDRWNLERYRDERAVDIEQRLERSEPIVKNPF